MRGRRAKGEYATYLDRSSWLHYSENFQQCTHYDFGDSDHVRQLTSNNVSHYFDIAYISTHNDPVFSFQLTLSSGTARAIRLIWLNDSSDQRRRHHSQNTLLTRNQTLHSGKEDHPDCTFTAVSMICMPKAQTNVRETHKLACTHVIREASCDDPTSCRSAWRGTMSRPGR